MERGEEAPVEGAPTAGALTEAALREAALAEAGAPDISEAPLTDAPTSEETGPKEPQVPISLGAESACDTSETGGARGLVIPVPSRAEPHGTRPSTARGRALQKAMRGEWL